MNKPNLKQLDDYVANWKEQLGNTVKSLKKTANAQDTYEIKLISEQIQVLSNIETVISELKKQTTQNNDNIQVITKDQIINMTNNDKRKSFIDEHENWGVWLDVPELNAKFYKAMFPDESSLIMSKFNSIHNVYPLSPEYHLIPKGRCYTPHSEGITSVIEKLKSLRKEFI